MKSTRLPLTPEQESILDMLGITRAVVTTNGDSLHILPLEKEQADRVFAEALEGSSENVRVVAPPSEGEGRQQEGGSK